MSQLQMILNQRIADLYFKKKSLVRNKNIFTRVMKLVDMRGLKLRPNGSWFKSRYG